MPSTGETNFIGSDFHCRSSVGLVFCDAIHYRLVSPELPGMAMKTQTRAYLTALALALFVVTAHAASNDVIRMERDIELKVSNGQFMGAVLVVRNGKALLNKGYGKADLDWQIPNSPTTKYRLGSITKQFTAACILLLEERGKLKVEDPIKKYLPDAPAAWDQITIFNLLTHTSGIPNYTDFPDFYETMSMPTTAEKLVGILKGRPLDFPPGTGWNYSNSGYILLGYLIEKISGMTYPQFLQDDIFTPFGMADSGYDSNTQVIERHAVGYARGPGGPVVAAYIDMSVPFAAGALYSTTGDLLRWETALFGGKVISAASLKRMTTPFKNNYAFGLEVIQKSNGDRQISHDGGIPGFNTSLIYDERDKSVVVVLANLNGAAAGDLGSDLSKVVRGDKVVLTSDRKAISLAPSALDAYAGHYQFPSGTLLTVRRDGDHLTAQLPGQPPIKNFAEGQQKFFTKDVDAQITFQTDANGQPTSLVFHQNETDRTATHVDEALSTQLVAALEFRVKSNIAAAGSEAALRRHLSDLAAGTTNFDLMQSDVAAQTRKTLSEDQMLVGALGAIRSLEFKGVGPDGSDRYSVRFERGLMNSRILMAPDGKIGDLELEPGQ